KIRQVYLLTALAGNSKAVTFMGSGKVKIGIDDFQDLLNVFSVKFSSEPAVEDICVFCSNFYLVNFFQGAEYVSEFFPLKNQCVGLPVHVIGVVSRNRAKIQGYTV